MVIGSGFGGIAAAVRLRAMGYPVTLLEARDQAGGRASVFEQDGYTFDAGPTVITAPYLFEELFALAGRRMQDYIELMPVDPFYRITFVDGRHFDYVGDEDRLLAQIAAFNPDDVEGYKRLAEHSRRIFEIGYEQLADQPFDNLIDMLRVVPDMLRLGNYRSVYSLVAKYIKDDSLRQVFTFQPLLVGGNPFNVTSIYLLIHWLERKWGVHFARGGTAAIVSGLMTLLEEIGVDVRLSTPVAEIVVEGARATAVLTEDGERIACSMVVSNADPSFTYKYMIPSEHRPKNNDGRVGRVKQSMGLFVGYFGTDKKYDAIAHHTIVLGPRYKELLTDIFDKKVLAEDFSLYLHRPTASDPSLAPPGHDAFYVLAPVPNNESGLDWDKLSGPYFERILQYLEERHLPGLSEHLTVKFSTSPDYFEQELRSVSGAGFGPEPRLTQSAWFRYHNRCDDIAGLYFVGAGVHPGAGVPGVLTSAKVLEKLVAHPSIANRVPIAGAPTRATA
ncbi:MAG: phytoene desaturase [Bradymonadaceae bacterium]|nr:phytoene desaturase [Lujinxingiaceae bacterium]